MDGSGDTLSNLWKLLSGAGQAAQQPQQPVPAGRLGMVPASATSQTPAPAPAIGGGLGDILSSPLAQGALSAYFGYLGRPRGLFTNRWQGLGQAGLAGLQGFEQAREQQLKLPQQQAELMAAQRKIAPVSADTLKALQGWRASLKSDPKTTPQELALADTLESQARGGKLTEDEARDTLMKWDQQKRDAEVARAQMGEQMMGWMAPILAQYGMTPGASTAGTAPAGAPPTGGAAPAPGRYPHYTTAPDFATVGAAEFTLSRPGKGDTYARYLTDEKTGKTSLYIVEGGTWRPMTP